MLGPGPHRHGEDLIHELRQHYTVAIVTHNMQQASRVADYTAFFYLGELIEFGETKQLLNEAAARQQAPGSRGASGACDVLAGGVRTVGSLYAGLLGFMDPFQVGLPWDSCAIVWKKT